MARALILALSITAAVSLSVPAIAMSQDADCNTVTAASASWHRAEGAIATVVAAPDVSKSFVARARLALDRANEYLVAAIGLPDPEVELTICLTRKISTYRDIVGTASPTSRLAIVESYPSPEFEQWVLHETTHLLAGERSRKEGERALPIWLNEGIAEVVAAGDFEQLHAAALELKKDGKLPGLHALQSEIDPRSRAFYVASGSITATLIEIKGWDGVWEMLKVKGKLPARLESSWHMRLESI